MKTKTKIVLSILGVFIVIISVTAILQWNNIKAFVFYLRYSEEEITGFAQDNNELIDSALHKVPNVTVRDLTDDERKKLSEGEISPKDAAALIVGKNTETKPTESDTVANDIPPSTDGDQTEDSNEQPSEDKDEEQVEDSDHSQDRIAELIAEIYILRAHFTGSLEGLRKSAVTEYKALPKQQRTSSVKQEIGIKYLQLALGLEDECDGLMNNLLAELELELKNTGGDLSIISDIKSIYANEKSLKKAEYLNMYS